MSTAYERFTDTQLDALLACAVALANYHAEAAPEDADKIYSEVGRMTVEQSQRATIGALNQE